MQTVVFTPKVMIWLTFAFNLSLVVSSIISMKGGDTFLPIKQENKKENNLLSMASLFRVVEAVYPHLVFFCPVLSLSERV